jgi:integrase
MATIQWRGTLQNIAYLDWRENGERQRINLGKITESQAETIRLAKELELQSGEIILTAGVNFGAFAHEYLSWHELEYPDSHFRIRQLTEQYLVPCFGQNPMNQIKLQLGEKYKQKRAKDGAKANTVNKELRTLKAILNKAIEWEFLNKNPLSALKPLKILDSKPPRFYSAEELESIYCMAPYNWYYWKFMANTGLRLQEFLQVKWRDIENDNLRVISTVDSRTKSGKWRDIPLSPGALMTLDRFAKDQKDEFLAPRMNDKSLSRAFSRVLKRTDIESPKGSLHCLRHTFCSHLVMQGKPIRLVQQLAGHANISTTERYVHLAPDYLKGSTADLNL